MDPTMTIRKHASELKERKTVRTAIKQDLSPDLKPLNYTIWDVLENKTNATSHPRLLLRRNRTKCLKNLF